jgi:ubiquitin-conjugating enzyme E2 D/E
MSTPTSHPYPTLQPAEPAVSSSKSPTSNPTPHTTSNLTQNGKFLVKLTLPTEYPFKPPTVSFATKIYHPNVTNDDKGSMCLGMLRPDEWKPSSKIAAVLQFARQLLSEPMPDDAVESRIADQYKNDRGAYDATAREWTRKHAHAKPT